MRLKNLAMALLTATVLWSCSDDYDDTQLRKDVNDLKSRVEKLETWCTETNSQISSLQSIVTALEDKDYVTGVSPTTLNGRTGYIITFSKSEPITILNGKDGEAGAAGTTPVIGVAKDIDNLYYWTVKYGDAEATWIKDAEGNKVATTGATGATPKLSVAEDGGKLYWQVDGKWLMNGNSKVPVTGDKGDKGEQGDAVFKTDGVKVNETDGTVTFTLAGENGATFTLPMAGKVKIFDSFDTFIAKKYGVMTLALNVKKGDYVALKAEICNAYGANYAVTRAATAPWGVKLTAPTFKEDGTIDVNGKVEFTFPEGITDGEFALLKVTVVSSQKGQEHSATRVVEYDNLEAVSGDIIANCGNAAIATMAIKSNASSNIEEQGILYGKESVLDIASSNKIIATLDKDGSAKVLMEELELGTEYYYCSYVKSNGNFDFGETKHFTTDTQNWQREADYITNFDSEDCIKDFTTIKLEGDGRPWHVVPIKVNGLPSYVLASSSLDISNLFAGRLTQTKDANNILQYTADFTNKVLPAISIYAIDVDGFLVGSDRNSSLDVLVSSSPITNISEANAADKIGTIQFTPKEWQASSEFLLPAKYSNTICYIALHNKAVFANSIGVLLGEFVSSSLVAPKK